jgi:hypothetical protein
MKGAKPQAWANTLWAAAKLGCCKEGAQLLKQLAGTVKSMAAAKPQEWSNSVWAAATLYEAAVDAGDKQLTEQLQHSGSCLLAECVKRWDDIKGAVPQNWSNTIWAAAKLGCAKEGCMLLAQLASDLDAMAEAKPQEWSNILWAAAVLCWYDQGLFSLGVTELAAMPSTAVKPQHLSNSLLACAVCAHWDSGVQQLLGRLRECDLAQFNTQQLANTAWAWAVLACLAQEDGSYQQHSQSFQQVAASLFKEAASRPASSFSNKGLTQLHQAHLYASYQGMPGMPAGQVLEKATTTGLLLNNQTTSSSQEVVNRCLREMGYTTQLEMFSPDALMRADIVITALPDGSSCHIAVEYDGSYHYIAEHRLSGATTERLDGPTRLRNALLSKSFPDGLVCIPWREWVSVEGNKKQEYLRRALGKVMRDKVGAPILSCLLMHVSMTCYEGRNCSSAPEPSLHRLHARVKQTAS